MARQKDKSRKPGGEMRFLDELDVEADVLGRLGRGEGRVYDEGYGSDEESEQGLLEFNDDGIPLGTGEEDEEPSNPVRIFVGRSAVAAGSHEPIDDDADYELGADGDSMVGIVESSSAPIAAAAFDDAYDVDDDFDEFEEEAAPVPLRAPDNAPGMRLLTPEREESLDTDRAWPGLRPTRTEPQRDAGGNRPSWLDSLPTVQPRASDTAQDQEDPRSRSWDAPLLDFGSGGPDRKPAWSLEEDDELEAGDEEGGELPVHEPLSFDDDYEDYDEEADYSGAFGAPPADEEDEDEADTGTWNRLAVLASAEVAEREQSQFGVSPAPVWQAEDPGEEADLDRFSGGWDSNPVPFGEAPTAEAPLPEDDVGPALPPIQPMASVLQAELNARTPVQPKAVVLKTLDGIQRPPTDALDDPADLRSRVPDTTRRSGRVEAQTGPVAAEAEGGSGRLLLVMAVTLLFTVGAVWQWRSTLFPETGIEPVPLDKPVKVAKDDPSMLKGTAGTDPPDEATDAVVDANPDALGDKAPPAEEQPPPAPTPPPPPDPVPAEPTPEEAAAAEEEREEALERRRAALHTGVLYVSSDRKASVYVNGKRVATAPMALPGVELKPGHYDIKVVPHGGGKTYRTNTRVDAGRVRNIELTFNK